MKISVSSRLAEARELRKRVLQREAAVRMVKFTPQQMAFGPFADDSSLKFNCRGLPNRMELDPGRAARQTASWAER